MWLLASATDIIDVAEHERPCVIDGLIELGLRELKPFSTNAFCAVSAMKARFKAGGGGEIDGRDRDEEVEPMWAAGLKRSEALGWVDTATDFDVNFAGCWRFD